MMNWKVLKMNLMKIWNKEVPLSYVYDYLLGNYRYSLYYSKYGHFLLRDFIVQQIEFRISVMNIQCYNNGECIKCGCATTNLQMCNRMCDDKCYPIMMSKKEWNKFKRLDIFVDNKNSLFWYNSNGKLNKQIYCN